jgi:hypothetical protein
MWNIARRLFMKSNEFRVFLVLAALLGLGLQACAPLYYPAPPPPQSSYSNTYPNAYPGNYQGQQGYQQPYPSNAYPSNYQGNSYQPAVVVVKSCECPPQGLGFVRIHSAPPFASVYINGKAEGETPLEYLSIPAGKAHIELIHRQFGPADTVLDIRPGQKIELKMHLTQYTDDDEEDEDE